MDEIIEQATTPWGTKKFFPPGSHPATARWRQELAKLEKLPPSPERDEILAYGRELLARLEEGESEAKVAYLLR